MKENEAKGMISYMENSIHTETCEKCLYIKSQCKCKKSEINAGCIGINEAQEYLLNRYLVVGSPVNPSKEECEKHNAVLDIAIQALEEIQQYRTIGTVEECELAINEAIDKHNLMIVYKDRLKDYEAIGPIDEFKSLKECFGHTVIKSRGKAIYDKAIDDFVKRIENHTFTKRTEEYSSRVIFMREIRKIAEELKGKNEPKKPLDGGEVLGEICPTCGRFISKMNNNYYCPCGQAINCSE